MTVRVYLDNNATAPLDERVLEAMLPVLRHAGNASSGHAAGGWARDVVEHARDQVASLVNGGRQEIIFTCGATEANNLAIKGFAAAAADPSRRRIVSATTEHAAVLGPLQTLRRSGFDVRLVRVGSDGVVDTDQLEAAITCDTLLVTIMAANNETGVLAPLPEIAALAHRRGAVMHTDATQLMAWGGLDTEQVLVDLVSLSAHKFHGPQGVGALFVRRYLQPRLRAVIDGGGHERGLRSGTLNTAGIAGAGLAAKLAADEGQRSGPAVAARRDRLERLLAEAAGEIKLNGSRTQRVPGTLNIAVADVDAEVLLATTPDVAMSTGSACTTGVPGPSHVLAAMGLSGERAESSIRLSLSRITSNADIEMAATSLSESIQRARALGHLVGVR